MASPFAGLGPPGPLIPPELFGAHGPRRITEPLLCAAFRMRTAAVAASISVSETPGLACAAGFAGVAFFGASGADLPQAQISRANTRHADARRAFRKINFAVFVFMGKKLWLLRITGATALKKVANELHAVAAAVEERPLRPRKLPTTSGVEQAFMPAKRTDQGPFPRAAGPRAAKRSAVHCFLDGTMRSERMSESKANNVPK